MQVLQLHSSLAIAPDLTSQFGDGAIYARATSNFHGRPWFSSVIFNTEENNERYGQLRLMFKCDVITREGVKITKELALLRMYQYVNSDEICLCPVIKFEEGQQASYMVVETSSIIRAVQIIPHFGNMGHYFVNLFKF